MRVNKFQSTPPRGGRPVASGVEGDIRGVSIHAPTRGATRIPSIPSRSGLFQSTPPRGGRRVRRMARHHSHSGFNPRPHAGGDSRCPGTAGRLTCFNPRPHAGGDKWQWSKWMFKIVSIHAPTRGATLRYPTEATANIWFQSTPPRGGRPRPARQGMRLTERFNPRPHAGGDTRLARRCIGIACFNPRPHAGGDR